MNDSSKTKQQLIDELAAMRKRVAQMEQSELSRRRTEEALKESEQKYKLLAESMNDIVWIMDMNLRDVYVSPSILTVLGFSQEERMQQSFSEQLTPDSLSTALAALAGELAIEKEGNGDRDRSVTVVLEFYHKNGSTRWLETIVSGIRDHQGVLTSLYGVSRDITERRRDQEALHESEARIRVLFNNIPVPTFVWKADSQNIILEEFNSAALEFTRGDMTAFIGKTADEYFKDYPGISDKIRQCFLSQTSMENSFWYRLKNDPEERYVLVKYAYAAPDHVIMHVNDLTAQKKAEENLKHISIHDALTGLYNRFYSDTEIDRINTSRIRPVSFIVIDLNDLKEVNDKKGHAAGDLYIKNTAALLKQTFRPEDIIARTGGDEFIVMLPLVDEETCAQAFQRLMDNLTEFNRGADHPISLAAGFSTAVTGDGIETIIAEADRRMYEEKARSKAAFENKSIAG